MMVRKFAFCRMTLNRMTLIKMKVSRMTQKRAALTRMIFSRMSFSKMVLSKLAFSRMTLYRRVNNHDIKRMKTFGIIPILLSVILLNVVAPLKSTKIQNELFIIILSKHF